VSTALDALRRALEQGDIDALAPAYGRNAELDASLPGPPGRRRIQGRAAIAEELARWWDGPGDELSFDATVFERGAALWTERDGVRLRHYLHFSGDLIVRHWVYSARPQGAFGGNSGAAVERRGELVVKRVVPLGGWMGRATRDEQGRSARLWLDGQIARLPVQLDTAIQRVEQDDDGYLIHMRDISEHLIGDERRLGPDELYAVLGAAAGMHREFHGEDVRSATRVEDMLSIASAATVVRETGEPDLAPKQMPAGWEAFAQAVPGDIAEAVGALLHDPGPLAAALARDGLTLIHGDLRDDNLGVLGNDVFLIDWDLAAMATPGVELVWFLLEDAWRADLSREEIIALALAAEGALLDERGLALGAVAGMCTFGWLLGHSAVIHPDPSETAWAKEELAFWMPRVREGIDAL
jgi:phosphotransferase family enzyme